MGRKIFITGNVFSGKTTLGSLLASTLGEELYSIDDYRRHFNQSCTQAGEDEARTHFFRAIVQPGNCVIEQTGSGRIWDEAWAATSRHQRIVIRLDACRATLEDRMLIRHNSDYEWPPFPSSWGFDHSQIALSNAIDYIGMNMTSDCDLLVPDGLSVEEGQQLVLQYLALN